MNIHKYIYISEPYKLLDIEFKIIGRIPFIAQLCVHPVVHGPSPPNLILLRAGLVAVMLWWLQPWLLLLNTNLGCCHCVRDVENEKLSNVNFPSIDTP